VRLPNPAHALFLALSASSSCCLLNQNTSLLPQSAPGLVCDQLHPHEQLI